MSFRYKSLIAAVSLLAMSSVGHAEEKAEVLHWWATGGSATAIKIFADSFNANGGKWVDNAINNGDNALPAGLNRIVGGNPPTVMQLYTALIPELAGQGLLANLDAVAKQEKWAEVLPSYVMDLISYDGHVYGAPVNRITHNWVWYNKALFAKLNIPEPATWDDFFAAAEKLKANGIVPFAFSDQAWQVRTLFHAVAVGVAGKEAYEHVYKDRNPDAVKSPEFRKAVEAFVKLRGYTDSGLTNRQFNESAAMIVRGTAGMTIMGDWEKGEYKAAGWVAEKDYGCILGLGNGVFAQDSSVFVMPKNGSDEATAAQALMAKTFLDPTNQLKFNVLKGSLPVRTDVDPSQIDACAAKGAKIMADASKRVQSQDALPQDMSKSLNDVEVQLWANPTMPIDAFLEKYASVLAQFEN